MLAKLTPDILDRLDIFVMEIEELQIPQPIWWEYIWCLSILSSFLGLSAVRGNKIREIKKYMMLITIVGILPIVYCLLYYFPNVWEFLFLEIDNKVEGAEILLWKNYPYCILWYAFCVIGIQIHLFTIFFSWNLLKTWNARITSRKCQ
ncbi:JAGN1 family protein [Megaselia abdita]